VKVKNRVPQGSIFGPLFFFLFYINNLPGIVTDISQPVLFADDSSIFISKPNPTEFIDDINKVFGNINDWIKINLSLNFDKTYYVQFLAKNNQEININTSCRTKLITNTHSTNFLGLIIDNALSWKNRIDKFGMLCNQSCQISYDTRILKDNLFLLFSFCYDIWYNFLGQFILLQ
jgi:hypothetical protein